MPFLFVWRHKEVFYKYIFRGKLSVGTVFYFPYKIKVAVLAVRLAVYLK